MTTRRWPLKQPLFSPRRLNRPRFNAARLTATAAAALLAVIAVLCPASSAAFTAQVSNATNTAQAAPYFTCAAAATGDAAFFAYPLAETSGATATDVSGNNRTGAYQGTVTRSTSQACARDSGGSTSFNGVDAYVATPTQVSDPETFTEETWFKTTVAGGKLMGFGAAQTGPSNNYDRHIYLNTAGQLVFGVCPGGGLANIHIVTSPASYTDNTWHDMAATFSPSTGIRLYVDGALVASDATVTGAEVYTGYWRIGYDNTTSWPGAPNNNYFTGSMAFPAVYTTALSATQIKNHHTAGAPATTTTATAAASARAAVIRPAAGGATTPQRHTPPATAKPPRRRATSTPRRPRTTSPPLHHPTGKKGTTRTPTPPPPATGPAPTPAPGPPPHETRFASPTGNISCDLSDAQLTCTITHHITTAPPPAPSCQPGDPWTVALSVTGPATLTCPSTAPVTTPPSEGQSAQQPRVLGSPAQPLPYGATLTNTTFTCTSTPAGMDCYRRSDHHGFHLSRTGLTPQTGPKQQHGHGLDPTNGATDRAAGQGRGVQHRAGPAQEPSPAP